MKRLLIAGNWKMNLSRTDAAALARAVVENAPRDESVEVALLPPFVYLPVVSDIVKGSSVSLGAQNMYFETSGAFPGEISPTMLFDFSCTYVVLGHSERRHVLGETDAAVNKKVLKALATGLTPILCVGEKIEEREAQKMEEILRRQVTEGLKRVSAGQVAGMVIA